MATAETDAASYASESNEGPAAPDLFSERTDDPDDGIYDAEELADVYQDAVGQYVDAVETYLEALQDGAYDAEQPVLDEYMIEEEHAESADTRSDTAWEAVRDLLQQDPDELGQYSEHDADESAGYMDIAVVQTGMPSSVAGFTFTDPGADKAVFINDNLYKVDRGDRSNGERGTETHEEAHVLNPGKDELTVRYIDGTPDNTLTWAQDLGDREDHRYARMHEQEQQSIPGPVQTTYIGRETEKQSYASE